MVIEENENEQIVQRKTKLAKLRQNQQQAYPNDFKPTHASKSLLEMYDSVNNDILEKNPIHVAVAGRVMTRRLMGKASFTHIQDGEGRIQLYITRDALSPGLYEQFKEWDLGDIIGAEGELFKTKTGELSIRASQIRLLTKALRPMPDKFHGLQDQEQRFRMRYLDLIVNPEVKRVFELRSKLVASIREFLNASGFLEVETPMMHPIVGGATARPFITHHNAMNMDLYLRIAPELYLKRLVVGGFEKVYEINRNFRNEGISTRHNPEFTMLEFYEAYATYEDMINTTEKMLGFIAQRLFNTLEIEHQGNKIDLSKPFARMTVREAILKYQPSISAEQLDQYETAKKFALENNIEIPTHYGLGRIHMELFEKFVERKLQEPTFITAFPREVSPLARANDQNDFITDRFEFYMGGQEIANGFSELNDPEDQAARFEEQATAKTAGDLEAMTFDADYITALEYGLAPTAGEGIGIDRLLMLLTNQTSIRDVILFPLLKLKK